MSGREILAGWPIGAAGAHEGPRFLGERRRKLSQRKNDTGKSITHFRDNHCLTVAPTGAGKGVGAIIPNLLNYRGSVIVIDPKAENLYVTARYRRETLGQDILVVDPFEAVRPQLVRHGEFARHRINPLRMTLEAGSFDESDAQALSRLFSGQSASAVAGRKDPFWDIVGHDLLAGLIFYVCKAPHIADPSINRLIALLRDDDFDYKLAVILDSDPCLRTPEMAFAKRAFTAYLTAPDYGTRPSILAITRSYLGIFSSRSVADYLSGDDISVRQFDAGRRASTTYVVIPPEKLDSHSVVTRTIIGTLLRVILARQSRQPEPVLFILDECAQLGEMDELRRAVTLLRGYGLRVWMFFQDLSQMNQLYRDDYATLIHNCGMFQAFGFQYDSQLQTVAQVIGKVGAEELAAIGPNQQVVMVNGARPVIAERLNYYADAAFAGRWTPNPLHS
ncbi:MAG: type IV secretory system conjugative DNA transfer family protein [Oceanicaulis sp.]